MISSVWPSVRQVIRVAIGLLSALALIGCTVGPKAPPPFLEIAKRQSHWGLQGRFSARSPGNGWQGVLKWVHEPDQDRILISGPLGVGAVSLVLSNSKVFLRRSDGSEQMFMSSIDAAKSQLGVPVPLDALSFWVRGMPAPTNAVYSERRVEKALAGFQQLGWELSFRTSNGAGGELPNRIVASSNGYRIQVLIDEWDGSKQP